MPQRERRRISEIPHEVYISKLDELGRGTIGWKVTASTGLWSWGVFYTSSNKNYIAFPMNGIVGVDNMPMLHTLCRKLQKGISEMGKTIYAEYDGTPLAVTVDAGGDAFLKRYEVYINDAPAQTLDTLEHIEKNVSETIEDYPNTTHVAQALAFAGLLLREIAETCHGTREASAAGILLKLLDSDVVGTAINIARIRTK